MTTAMIIEEALNLLAQLTEADFVEEHAQNLEKLAPPQRDLVVAALRSLPEQAATLASDADLLALAHGVISLIEETPLRELLLPPQTDDPAQRLVTVETWSADDAQATAHAYFDTHQPALINETQNLQPLLDRLSLTDPAPPPDLPAAEPGGQARRDWWQHLIDRLRSQA